ncbi:hypothetical protein [Streptomyces sp. NBC_00094]|uniref:hypothetical protein n=1 Tax=Streptomyces sp. NBC_00094 TaxID=2903620 RepID=UPI002256BBB9|nr:hypothetical protein [Streptomyces sp. NBC_00094]MCX5388754.1 hypothetical protein [Streptomyces sp. NBC_00094]
MPTLSHEEPRRNVAVPSPCERCPFTAGCGPGRMRATEERRGAVSQEERDARLGLTGLTGAEREARLRLLREEIEREVTAARAARDAGRKGQPHASQDAGPAFDAPEES